MLKPYVLAAAGAWIYCATLHADCDGVSRPATEIEKRYYVESMSALRSLAPPAPAGWRVMDNNHIVAPSTTCEGAEKTRGALRYEVTYFWAEGEKAKGPLRAEQRRQIEALRALPPEQQKQCEELDRRARDLDRQRRKVLASGDKVEAARLGRESADLAARSYAVQKEHLQSVKPKLDALSREYQAQENAVKTEVRLEIAVNWISTTLNGEINRLAFPGAAVALRSGEKTFLAFGPWKTAGRNSGKAANLDLRSAFSTSVPATTVQTVLVRVSGTPKQADDVLAGLDAAKVTRLLGR